MHLPITDYLVGWEGNHKQAFQCALALADGLSHGALAAQVATRAAEVAVQTFVDLVSAPRSQPDLLNTALVSIPPHFKGSTRA